MLGDCIEFVSTIHSACSYGKKASGKTLIRELMNESWYSQKDYQQVTHLQCRFTELCEFWVHQNRVNQDSDHMSEEYSSLSRLRQLPLAMKRGAPSPSAPLFYNNFHSRMDSAVWKTPRKYLCLNLEGHFFGRRFFKSGKSLA